MYAPSKTGLFIAVRSPHLLVRKGGSNWFDHCLSKFPHTRTRRYLYSTSAPASASKFKRQTAAEAKINGDDFVISGISGRFPDADNMEELTNHLYSKTNMVKEQTRFKCLGIPPKHGLMKNLDKFDAQFFGVVPKMIAYMDPQLRTIHEVTFEAIVDSGMNPSSLRGTNTGVFVGALGTEYLEHWLTNLRPDGLEGYFGNVSAHGLANRLSYTFDLRGPSCVINAACSSSFYAMDAALNWIRANSEDSVIVAGACTLLSPFITADFMQFGALSPGGESKPFDASADGFVRSEAIVAMLVQRRAVAKRAYATIEHVKTSADGYKTTGITCPSSQAQGDMLKQAYVDVGIDPTQVGYVETHGTGTVVGDSAEIQTISSVFADPSTSTRSEPLLFGSVKSNMGHTEWTAGLCGIAKAIITMQNGQIPPNLNFTKPQEGFSHYFQDGRVKLVTETTPFKGKYIGLNSFGIGGTNSHVILSTEAEAEQSSSPASKSEPESGIPSIFPFSGRTEEGVKRSLEKTFELVKGASYPELRGLLHNTFKTNVVGHPFRGYGFVIPGEEPTIGVKLVSVSADDKGIPVCLVFPGLGSQENVVEPALLQIEPFKHSLEKSVDILKKQRGIDLKGILDPDPDNSRVFKNIRDCTASLAAVQIALCDTLQSVGIHPDVVIGHSTGEFICGYVDGTFTAEEALLVADAFGQASENCLISHPTQTQGLMAAVSKPWEELQQQYGPVPSNVYLACRNGSNSVTIGGQPEAVTEFSDRLKSQGVTVKLVNSCGIAPHTPLIHSVVEQMEKYINDFYPKEKNQRRSRKWVSSSVSTSDIQGDFENTDGPNSNYKYNSAAYQANNIKNVVLFQEAVDQVCASTLSGAGVVIEVAPKPQLRGLLKKALSKGTSAGNSNDKSNVNVTSLTSVQNVKDFLSSLGGIYTSGVDVDFGALYPPVSFPVSSRTPTVSNLINWNHEQSHFVPLVSNLYKATSEGIRIPVDLTSLKDKHLQGHKLDDRTVYPATGYLYLAWKGLSLISGVEMSKLPVKMENVSFQRATLLYEDNITEFRFSMLNAEGLFEIRERDSVVARGKISAISELAHSYDNQDSWLTTLEERTNKEPAMSSGDVYKEFQLRGYKYSGDFKGIQRADIQGTWVEVSWVDNWIAFLDTVLQASIVGMMKKPRLLALPVRIQSITIDPTKLSSYLTEKAVDVVPVELCERTKTTRCPGVQISGLSTVIGARLRNEGTPTLTTSIFRPFDDQTLFQDTSSSSWSSAVGQGNNTELMNILYLIFENNRMKKLKVLEVFENSEEVISKSIQNFMMTKPLGYLSEYHLFGVSSEISKLDEALLTQKNFKVGELPFSQQLPLDPTLNLLVFQESIPESVQSQLLTSASSVSDNLFVLLHSTSDLPADPKVKEFLTTAVSARGPTKLRLLRKRFLPHLGSIKHLRVDDDTFQWLPQLQDHLKAVVEDNDGNSDKSRIYLVSQNNSTSGITGFVKNLFKESGGNHIRCIFDPQGQLNLNFENPDTSLTDILEKDLVTNVIQKGQLGSIVCIPQQSTPASYFSTREVEDAYVKAISVGDLSSLKWVESPMRIYRNVKQNGDLVYCRIKTAALNFKDIMLASGKLSIDPLSKLAEDGLGFEFAGHDKNGNRVMGLVHGGRALATSVCVKPFAVLPVPDTWTLEDAATVPIAYFTLYYSFFVRNNIRAGQSILIHSGTGAVGQAAINLALHNGLKVYTTVGSDEKRKILQELYPQIHNNHIFGSRDTRFEHEILRQTDGKGVDLVLNSLSEDKLQASVRCMAHSGKFMEIGNFDMTQNNPLGMSSFLKNVDFQGIDASTLTMEDNVLTSSLLRQGIADGVVKPLTTNVFHVDQIEEAFRFMSSGKHTGKVVIQVENKNRIEKDQGSVKVEALSRSYFYPNKAYIIIGGLGGLGLETANFLVERGCKHLVLISRSGVTGGYQAFCVNKWRERGVQVETPQVDLSDYNTAKKFMEALLMDQKICLGGIFNSGLVLRDAAIENQTVDMFKEVSLTKINVTRNLDKITRTLCPNLDLFVVYSSIIAEIGNEGQSSYGFSNSVMERICEQRKNDGLHGLAIQWGHIAEIGYVAETLSGIEEVIPGLLPQSLQSCIDILDYALCQNSAVISTTVVSTGSSQSKQTKTVSIAGFLCKYLGVEDLTKVSPQTTLSDLGIDSIIVTETQRVLERDYTITLSPSEVRQLTVAIILEIENQDSTSSTFFTKSSISVEPQDDSSSNPIPLADQKNISRAQHKTLTKLSKVRNDSKVFFIHGTDGRSEVLQPLASQLQVETYGFQVPKNACLSSLPELAAEYIEEMKLVQPYGPYNIVAYSSGGVVALEIAKQLDDLPHEHDMVCSLILLDGYFCHRNDQTDWRERYQMALEAVVTLNKNRNKHQAKLSQAEESVIKKFVDFDSNATSPEEVAEFLETLKSYENVLYNYQPDSTYQFQGNVVLCKVSGSESISPTFEDPTNKIQQYCARPVTVHPLPGDHFTMLRQPHVKTTAHVLNSIFNSEATSQDDIKIQSKDESLRMVG